jgi:hypothetical protein
MVIIFRVYNFPGCCAPLVDIKRKFRLHILYYTRIIFGEACTPTHRDLGNGVRMEKFEAKLAFLWRIDLKK